jgi:hypothetical protein
MAESSLLSPQGITAIASLLTAILWPAVVLVTLLAFRSELISLFKRVKKAKVAGVEVELGEILKESEKEAISQVADAPRGPTQKEIARANKVDELSAGVDSGYLDQQLSDVAREYEQVRASLPASSERTRKMSTVASKMRALGAVAFKRRYRLMASPSPGDRLLAICGLQVFPDFEMIEWLANRVENEKPFVGYHAILALTEAAKNGQGKPNKLEFTKALAVLQKIDLKGDPGRTDALAAFKAAVSEL